MSRGRVCAFEYRYGSEEMKRILDANNFMRKILLVEATLVKVLEKLGIAPKGCYEKVSMEASRITFEEVQELEKSLGHETAALAILLARRCGECGKYVHLGLTSNDVIDTAWALVLRDALDLVKKRLCRLIELCISIAEKHRNTVMVGRTHGQHALPITFGFKMANYVYEFSRSLERLLESEKRIIRGKVAGAVGTMASWGSLGEAIERGVLEELGLEPHAITTQVAPRDGFAELACNLAVLASQLDRLALEVRELSRTEIGEVGIAEERIGSSTMPHKKNPVTAERVSGLARVCRSLCLALLENIVLMHERDLTNSSCERVVVPHILLVVDQMLLDTLGFLEKLVVDKRKMMENLELTKGAIASECLMMKLVLKRGIPRHEAHEALMKLSRKALSENRSFREVFEESELSRLLDKKDVMECFDYQSYTGRAGELIDRALSYARGVLEKVRAC